MARVDFSGSRQKGKPENIIKRYERREAISEDVINTALLFANDLNAVIGEFNLYLFGGHVHGRHKSLHPDIDLFVQRDYLTQMDKVNIRRVAAKYKIIDCKFGETPPNPSKLIVDYAND